MHMTVASEKRPARWSRRSEARPGELVQAALELFVERGYASTRLEDVAQRAGVSKGTIYLYYGSKEELMRAAIRLAVQPKLQFAEEVMERSDRSTRDMLRLIAANWMEDNSRSASRGILKLLVSECRNFPELGHFYCEEVMQRGRAFWLRLLRRGIERGELRDIDPDAYLAVVTAPLTLLTIWQHSLGLFEKPSIDPRVYLETYVDMLFQGLGRHGQA